MQTGGADDRASSVILGITDSFTRIKNFADFMIKEKVLPVSLLDVTYDYVEANDLIIARKF